MNRKRFIGVVVRGLLGLAVLLSVYHSGVELGKRQAHKKLVDPIQQFLWPETSENDDPFAIGVSVDPFAQNPFSDDPFEGTASLADPFGDSALQVDPFSNN